jgi:hypothetical protein
MTLGRKDVSVSRTDGGADVLCLAGFFRDDDLISHNGAFRRTDSSLADIERTVNEIASQAVFAGGRPLAMRLASEDRRAGPGSEHKLAKVGSEGFESLHPLNILSDLGSYRLGS